MLIDRTTALNMLANLVRKKQQRGETTISDPATFFGFGPDDIACVHFWKEKQEGTWFRLKDGRVIDSNGKPSDATESLYALPTQFQPIGQ